MKLIDILAREMNEWPNDARSVTQLADGRLYHGGDGGCRGEIFYARAIDWIHAIVTREQWEEARRDLKAYESLAYTEAGPGLADSVMSPPAYDPVNSPSHYRQGRVECIDAIEAALTTDEFRGYCKGNALKYVWRELHKGGDESIEKAIWYLNRVKS